MKKKILFNPNHFKLTAVVVSTMLISCGTPKLLDFSTDTKIIKQVKYDHSNNEVSNKGRGYTLQLKQMKELPKRVALVSFYGLGPAHTKKGQKFDSNGNLNMSRFADYNQVPPEDMKLFVNQWYTASINPLKEVFKKNNMELLTADQFLDTDAKKAYYKKFQVEHSSGNKLKEFLTGGKVPAVIESAEGYNAIDIKNGMDYGSRSLSGCADGKMCEGVGFDLTKELGVDAVVVMNICVDASGKDRSLSAESIYMFGPNTVMQDLGKDDGFYSSKGVFYCGTRIFLKDKALLNPKPKKKLTAEEIKTQNDKGFENISVALAEKMGEYFKDWKPTK